MMTQNQLENQKEFNSFIDMLSQNLKDQVLSQIYQSSFERNSIFRDHTDCVKKLIKGISPYL